MEADLATPAPPPPPAPAAPPRRRVRLHLREGQAPVRDRLVATFFLVAMLHGILILGLTFGGPGKPGDLAPGLEVLMVTDEVPAADRNDAAAYLAQRTQLGSGTARGARSPRSPAAADGALANPGERPADAEQSSQAGAQADSDERVVTSTGRRIRVRFFTEHGSERDAASADDAIHLATRNMGRDEVEDIELRGPRRDELLITPDTRESVLAPYLDAWRGKVERIGTVNYPRIARRPGLVANPVLEVIVAADGHLVSATVAKSSGYADLDQAAIGILRLASPFDPFPRDLAARYRTLRFAYEWQFVQGRVDPGTVTAPADSN